MPKDFGHYYISTFASPHDSKEHILLVNPNSYSSNIKYITKYSQYIKFTPQYMNYDKILEQIKFNVYIHNDINHTDLMGIMPEYYLDIMYKLNTNLEAEGEEEEGEEEEEESKHKKNITHDMNISEKGNNLDTIRYVCGASYTYYYFMIPIGSVIFSINDPKLTINPVYIIYDKYTINKSDPYIKKNHAKIEINLLEKYGNDNRLNFIIDYVAFIQGSNKKMTFIPLYIYHIGAKEEEEDKQLNILGCNNYSMNILNKLNKSPSNKYNIMGFDEHDSIFTKDSTDHDFSREEEEETPLNKKVTEEMDELYDEYGYRGKTWHDSKDKLLNSNKYIEKTLLNKKTYINRKTKNLLRYYKLNNTLIQNVHVHDIKTDKIKCNYAKTRREKAIMDKKREKYSKSGYSLECDADTHDKHENEQNFNSNLTFPVKTFLFRNVVITNKYTNENLIYNLIYLFMEKIQLDKITRDNKLNLMSLNTNIELHKGAEDYYRKYGFITNIKNPDCVYSVGKKSCEVRTRYRMAP
jgi:hypothetical protein